MAINGLWNRRCGPGGGTRRLHQSFCYIKNFGGDEIGSTRVVKTVSFARYCIRRYRAILNNCKL